MQIVLYVVHNLRVGSLNGDVNKKFSISMRGHYTRKMPDLRFSCATPLQKRANACMVCTDDCELRQAELGSKGDRTMQAFRVTLYFLS